MLYIQERPKTTRYIEQKLLKAQAKVRGANNSS